MSFTPTNETMRLVAELLRERGVVAFGITIVEPSSETTYAVRASAASKMDDTETDAQEVMSKMVDAFHTVMAEMMEGHGQKEYLN